MASEAIQKPQTAQAAGKPTPMPVGKGLGLMAVALVMVIGVTVLATVLGCSIWIVWLGMVIWAAIGHLKVEPREVVKCWTSVAMGIALGYLLTHGQAELGTWALVPAFSILAFFIFGMVTHRWSFLCNNYTAAFLTVCTAQGLPLPPLQCAGSILYGFVVFGIIPLAFKAIMARRAKSEAASASANQPESE